MRPRCSAFVAGVTEPAIYGVTLRLRRPFIYACIGGMVGGAIAAAGGSAANGSVFPGLITLPAYMHVGSFTLQLIGTAAAVAIAFTLTLILGFEDVPPTARTQGPRPPGRPTADARLRRRPAPTAPRPAADPHHAPRPAPGPRPAWCRPWYHCPRAVPSGTVIVAAPLHGEVLALSEVPDPVFARGLMGAGVAIRPTNGVLRSPVEGTVASVARAHHAVGITSDDGVEILLHVGIDTVHLGGRPFETLVTQGQRVRVGTPLILVDLDALQASGCETATPIVVTNSATFASVDVVAGDQVTVGEPLLRVIPDGYRLTHLAEVADLNTTATRVGVQGNRYDAAGMARVGL